MTSSASGETPARGRRPPPPWRQVRVLRTERLSTRMGRVTLAGGELQGLIVDEPAASVRLLLPAADGTLVVPVWVGNEFLLPDGRRPTIRTLTPRRLDATRLELDVEIVIHGRGAASVWAETVRPGALVAVSGPARGYRYDRDAAGFFLAGDETALPAISQLVETLPDSAPVQASIEVGAPDARLALPARSGATVSWLDAPSGGLPGEALVAAVRRAELGPGTAVWVAGEAAAVQRVRRHLFEERGLPRARATVRGYWKYGREAGSADEP